MVFHQRFSTNTTPQWRLAQPFRLLAHNGEINTIRGNRRWMQAREAVLRSPLVDLSDIGPLVRQSGSDSESLDNALEVLLAGGLDMLTAMRVLVPPAYAAREDLDEDLAGFYEYYALHSEPWDGPAGPGHVRQPLRGLHARPQRPAPGALGVVRRQPPDRGFRGRPVGCACGARGGQGAARSGPDAGGGFRRTRRLLHDADIDAINRSRAPFRDWLRDGVSYLESDLIDPSLAAEPLPADELRRYQKLYGLSREERESVLKVLAETEAEATGSMGDDTPMAVMSRQIRPLFDRFREAFAQVTNPPIDPLRERLVMSLTTQIGPEGNLFELSAENAKQTLLNSPILLAAQVAPDAGDAAVRRCHGQDRPVLPARRRARAGAASLLPRGGAGRAQPAPAWFSSPTATRTGTACRPMRCWSVGAIHAHLVEQGLRCQCNMLVETATARDAHQFACLIGFGATAIYPWLAYQSLFELGRDGHLKRGDGTPREIGRSYRRGIRKGLLKILSKMGISTIAGYRGAQLFEIVGLGARGGGSCASPARPSRIGGAGFADLEHDQRLLAADAWNEAQPLRAGGIYKYVHGGEYHMYNPDVIDTLQQAVRTGSMDDYRRYAQHVDARPPSALRDLLLPQAAASPIALDEVEPVDGDPEALRLGRHVAGRAVARGARGAGDRDEPARRAQQFR